MMDKNLGLSDEIYDLFTKEITHVLHVAATVRFKESLKNSLRTNVLGLRELITLCNQCLKLKVSAIVVH